MESEENISTGALRERLENANYGRTAGWFVEYENEPIALLSDCRPQHPDMFWDQYKITPLKQAELLQQKLEDVNFWCNNPQLVFRNREFSDITLSACEVMISPHPESGTVGARGLFIRVASPTIETPPEEPTGFWRRFKTRLLKV